MASLRALLFHGYEKMTRQTTQTATIQTLPPELLSKIFLRCLVLDLDIMATRRSSKAPLLLGRVCSRWRAVSISTPDLWTTMVIGGHFKDASDNYRKDMVAINVWIDRSSTLPLSFHIRLPQVVGSHWPVDDYGRQILESIVSQSWRWKTIRAFIPLDFVKLFLAPLREGNTPKLEQFWGYCDPPRQSGLAFELQSVCLYSAPRLKQLRLTGSPIHVDFGGQIHHIEGIDVQSTAPGKLSLDDLLQCLTQCPSLKSLNMSRLTPSPTAYQHSLPTIIELRNLCSLQLRLCPAADPYLAFDRLFLPSITNLQLTMRRCKKKDWPHLLSMLKRSRPPLAFLALYGVPLAEITFLECLSCILELTGLTIKSINCSDITLSSLTIDDTEDSIQANLCPQLTYISFGPPSRFSPNAMKTMIISRRVHQAPNIIHRKKLNVVSYPSITMDSILEDPDIVHCIRDGLDLEEWEDFE